MGGLTSVSRGRMESRWPKLSPSRKTAAGLVTSKRRQPTTCSHSSIPCCARSHHSNLSLVAGQFENFAVPTRGLDARPALLSAGVTFFLGHDRRERFKQTAPIVIPAASWNPGPFKPGGKQAGIQLNHCP